MRIRTSRINSVNIFSVNLDKDRFIDLVNSLDSNKISSKILKTILEEYLETDKSLDEILKENNLVLVSDEKEIEEFINKVISTYPDSVSDYRNGKESAFKFLMGMVMKESKGKINPKTCDEVLKKVLDK